MSIETWTAERIDQLRNSVVSGLTCSQIAAEIGVSRNAVIGKIHRLGLSPARPPGAPAHSCPPRTRRQLSSQRQLLRVIYAAGTGGPSTTGCAPLAVDSAKPCSLLELANGTCRWPLSDPGAADFAFCGNEAATGFSYCAGHARMAYRYSAQRRA